ncbi:hypothetical protein K449DRAFT_401919 [Hypoxylon sp. EC38]|nr:hypothetical protein K449DRAFT_401919 [Hypoxylon sp. EC38]
MAKERVDKPRKERKEKAEKAEKKVSKDKVKKHKKEKKVKREASSDDSDNESSKREESPASVEEPTVETPTTAPIPKLKSEKEESQVGEKDKSKKKDKKSKKAALEATIAEDASNEATDLPMRPVSKDEDSEGEAPLFTIDTKPTKVNLESVAEKTAAIDEPKDTQHQKEEPQKSGYNPPPSGLNRQARRRIRMIEEKREKIQKDLGVPVGSNEKADEVQARLDAWVADFDGKAAIRMEKKKRRKEKEAARLRSKSGKVLTGRRLKERQKQLQKMEKKASKKQQRGGLSAVNTKA